MDLLYAINFKFNRLLDEIKSTEKAVYWLLRFVKPLLIISIVFVKGFKVLRREYYFSFDDRFHMSINNRPCTLSWDRFISFTETYKVLFLNLDSSTGKDGQVLIPKRVLSEDGLLNLKSFLNSHHIFEGDIDFNLSV